MGDATDLPMKRCSTCKVEKPRTLFPPNKNTKDGLQYRCRTCCAAATRKWQAENPEKVRARNVAWYAANKKRHAERIREWRKVNPESSQESMRKYLGKPEKKEAVRLMRQRWRLNNKEWLAQYAEEHRDQIQAKSSRRRALKAMTTTGPIDIAALWAEQADLCGLCGEPIDRQLRWPDPQSQSLDHIVPLALGGTHTQDNVQMAHLLCNVKKGHRVPDVG